MDIKVSNKTQNPEEKVIVTFRCSAEMQKFLMEKSGEESLSTLLRSWVREKMEAEKELQTA